MCGIIGYTGTGDAVGILLSGLCALEYRGYDSAGVSLSREAGLITVKSRGRVSFLKEKLAAARLEKYCCGIGHTRWATHGEPSDKNAHPHETDTLSLVHNGIIENHTKIKATLERSGYSFASETDTEIAACLIDFYYKLSRDPIGSVFAATRELCGSFAFGIIFKDRPSEIYAVRRDSPLVVAHTDKGGFIASDVTAILSHATRCFRLDEGVVALVRADGVRFYDRQKNEVEQSEEKIDLDIGLAQKSGFEHFMLKEIFEQPDAIRRTVAPRLSSGLPDFGSDAPSEEELARIGKIHLVACGTAMHAGMVGKVFAERLARVFSSVEVASEFRYRDPILEKNDLVILLSQSGETADTLAALRHAKSCGIRTLAIVNAVGSSVAREADRVIYTLAGPEIAVASTKAYCVQCAVLILLAVSIGLAKGRLDEKTAREICRALSEKTAGELSRVLEKDTEIRDAARNFCDRENIFYIGRGIDFALCAEGSLKLKEISYIHSEAYAAGELKHGTISLIEDGTPVIAVCTERELVEKTSNAIREVKARGAKVLLFAPESLLRDFCIPHDSAIAFEAEDESLALFGAACALQLFAYHAAALRGLDVDKPRNLAKSVTVE